jgi:L,D-transpeptidase ErfK/SrfK
MIAFPLGLPRRGQVSTAPARLLARAGMLVSVALLAGCGMFIRRPEPAPVAPQPPASLHTFPLAAHAEVVGTLAYTRMRGEETLLDVARRYDLGYDEIVAANPALDPWTPEPGARVVLPAAHVLPDAPRNGIVINLPARRLFYYPPPGVDGTRVVVTHPVGIGREGWGTPRGRLRVAARHAAPAWTVPASIRREHAAKGDPLPAIVPPGPDNPLGTHALRLSNPSYLIHGTNKPAGIGMRVSHGCIQLYPEDILTLYPQVPVGTPVYVVDQPYLAGNGPAGLVLEAHAPLPESAPELEASVARAMEAALARRGRGPAVDLVRAHAIARAARGLPLPVTAWSDAPETLLAALPPAPERPAAARDAPAPAGEWYVEFPGFRYPGNARRLAAMLMHLGPPVPAERYAAAGLHHVRAGPYPSRAEAQRAARRVARELEVTVGGVRRHSGAGPLPAAALKRVPERGSEPPMARTAPPV